MTLKEEHTTISEKVNYTGYVALFMNSKERKILKLAFEVSEEVQESNRSIREIRSRIEKMLSTGVSEKKAKQATKNMIRFSKNEIQMEPDKIHLYDVPDDMRDLVVNPR